MPINKITSSKRGKAAIAAAFIVAASGAWGTYQASKSPAAVVLAVDHLIKPWEGLVLKSHWDPFAKIYDICYGETMINGKPVTAGMSFTADQCEDMLITRVQRDYYTPLTKQISGFTSFPVSVQAAQISGAYNFGVAGMVRSRAATLAKQGKFREACEAQTAWNKAGGQVVNGLVKRREMGDAQRIGEAEICVSGLQ
ncbi:glycoside hydrolase family protein [Agrobacterium vitis]|uniref:lysozyme n=1 Tax=Rhizobium/Agrobacterium group TaxID=227290 RepID=UPI0008DBFDAD|nr:MULTISPECIES: lysozyme [Rhizobium/Agrobacterium group]MCF1437035.1 lysozyme [Allorhizobium ampelinum]MUO92642.1 glycoside hydrolase family protein [Agrobacterium vitis]MUZ55711.1 glycoside hydrolase family protein [Agrobacterium vitis]MUZ94215.1 glycoside hydrolase family protein [Agrobacterium vitis]MVA42978.1 glycoside hydrolase family protein [Agrobacterium vitis]